MLKFFFILDSDENWVGKSEYILCAVRWDSVTGVLMVTPDFTSVASSTEHTTRADPYRVEVDGDARNMYHYWIEHASADMSQEQKDKEFAIINKVPVILCGVCVCVLCGVCVCGVCMVCVCVWCVVCGVWCVVCWSGVNINTQHKNKE